MDVIFATIIAIGCIARILFLKNGSKTFYGRCLSCQEKYDSTTLNASKYLIEYEYIDEDGTKKLETAIVNGSIEVGSEFNVLLNKNGELTPTKHLGFLKTVSVIMVIYAIMRLLIPVVAESLLALKR